jgi:CHAT domain-containing protein
VERTERGTGRNFSLLPTWGAAALSRDTLLASSSLAAAERIGSKLASRSGDKSVAAMVAAIRRGNARARRRLARAHQAYGAGVRAFARGDYATGRKTQRYALEHAHGSAALRGWARVAWLSNVLHASTPDWSVLQFAAIARNTDAARYPALAARAFWGLATSLNKAGRQLDAIAAIQISQRLFASIDESEHLGATMQIEALSRVELQEGRASLDALRRALNELRRHRSSVWLHNTLWVYARAAAEAGFPHAALAFANEGVGIADGIANPRIKTESRIARARYAMSSGRSPIRDLDSAANMLSAIPSGPAQDWQRADLHSLRLASSRGLQPDTASLNAAVATFRRAGTPMKLVPALIARAKASLRRAELVAASRDLDDASRAIDGARAGQTNPSQDQRASDGVRDAWRQLAQLWIQAGQPLRALTAIDRSRRGVTRRSAMMSNSRVTAPRGSLVVSIAMLGDSIVTWTLVDDQSHFDIKRVVGSEWLAQMTRLRARLAVGVSATQLQSELGKLFEDVWRTPLSRAPASTRTILLVGDDELTALPLAAAYDATSRQYLIERYNLTFASRMTTTFEMPAGMATSGGILLIGDPAFSAAARPDLPRLPGAQGEVADVRAVYPYATVLVDSAATAEAARRALPRSSILHFAGHALFDVRHPARSELVLAASRAGEPDFLRAADLQELPLSNLRLVVLSACETASTGVGQLAGANGLVQAFLSAGAKGVIGSMWRVDDGATRALMSAFHRAYRESHDASAALRHAQLGMLRSHPALIGLWSGFKYEVQ